MEVGVENPGRGSWPVWCRRVCWTAPSGSPPAPAGSVPAPERTGWIATPQNTRCKRESEPVEVSCGWHAAAPRVVTMATFQKAPWRVTGGRCDVEQLVLRCGR